MTADRLLPWHAQNWQQIIDLHQAARLPHALLLHGLSGTGMRRFAGQVAQVLLCSASEPEACGECHACKLVVAGTHPDLMSLEPEKPFGPVKVDQVRAVVEFAHGTAQLGGYRVVIVCPAEAMNINAANALLKVLEEPGANTLLMLLSHAPAAVLATVRSRCQSLPMTAPSAGQGKEWLEVRLENKENLDILHQFAPRRPLQGLRLEPEVEQLQLVARSLPAVISGEASPLQVAQAWAPLELGELLLWLYQWLSEACLAEARPASQASLAACIYDNWTARAPLPYLLDLVDEILDLRRQLASGSNPNKALLLEQLLFRLAPGGNKG